MVKSLPAFFYMFLGLDQDKQIYYHFISW